MNYPLARRVLRKSVIVRSIYVALRTIRYQYPYDWWQGIARLLAFAGEYRVYSHMNTNPHLKLAVRRINPHLRDRTEYTPVEPVYFFQDAWAAGKIFQISPAHHVDVGSHIPTIGIVSQFVPTTIVDIRPIDLQLEQLSFQKGSILALPFASETVECISSICVVEHIGLGRYGDELDPWGSEKAISELKRVVKPGGHLLISVPVDTESHVQFNAHRAFTRDYLLALFEDLELVEEQYIYGRAKFAQYSRSRGFGTGLFHLRKPNRMLT